MQHVESGDVCCSPKTHVCVVGEEGGGVESSVTCLSSPYLCPYLQASFSFGRKLIERIQGNCPSTQGSVYVRTIFVVRCAYASCFLVFFFSLLRLTFTFYLHESKP